MDPFVGRQWLAEHRDEVTILDVRWYADGSHTVAAFERAHLPGAVHVELDRWLAGRPSPAAGRHPLPEPEVFAEGMRVAGVDERGVVAYDDAGGVVAARLVWMLRAVGHRAALLDGGLLGHVGPVARGPEPVPPRGRFTAVPWPAERLAGVQDAADPGAAVLLDARPPERFSGAVETLDVRAGHIPGARNLPCRANVRADGTLLPEAGLREVFAAAGVTAGREVISSCGSGVTACHTALVLEHLGLGPVRLYPGSWSQWAATDRPAATGG